MDLYFSLSSNNNYFQLVMRFIYLKALLKRRSQSASCECELPEYIYIYIYIYIKLSRNPSARWARHVLTTPDPEERVVSRRNFRSFVALRIADLGAMIQLSYFIPVRQWTCPSGSLNYSVNCCFRRRC